MNLASPLGLYEHDLEEGRLRSSRQPESPVKRLVP
jgi:hypothetical protein